MSPRAVVFDIGNVLIRWNPDQVYGDLMDADQLRRFHAETRMHDVNADIDRGAPWQASVEAAAQRLPEWADMIRLWYTDWHRMASPAIDGSVALLRALRRKGVPVFALSNFGVETFADAQTRYAFLEEFDQRFLSGHLGVNKPEPAIYAALETATGLSGRDLLFIDDLSQNIAGAEARGWRGHLFEGPAGLAQELVSLGLLAEDDI